MTSFPVWLPTFHIHNVTLGGRRLLKICMYVARHLYYPLAKYLGACWIFTIKGLARKKVVNDVIYCLISHFPYPWRYTRRSSASENLHVCSASLVLRTRQVLGSLLDFYYERASEEKSGQWRHFHINFSCFNCFFNLLFKLCTSFYGQFSTHATSYSFFGKQTTNDFWLTTTSYSYWVTYCPVYIFVLIYFGYFE